MRNRGKNRQRRGLPPPCGIHPAVLAVPACSYFRPLDGWGHMDGMEVPQNIPASVETCTSIAGALPWWAAVPSDRRRERRFCGVRPWKERHHLTEKGALPIDLPGHPCDPTRAWADHSLDAGPASYPREVLRGERPKWLFVHFGQSKWTPAERVSPRQGNKNTPEKSLQHTKKSQHRPQWSVLALLNVLTDFPGAHSPAWGTPPCRRDG